MYAQFFAVDMAGIFTARVVVKLAGKVLSATYPQRIVKWQTAMVEENVWKDCALVMSDTKESFVNKVSGDHYTFCKIIYLRCKFYSETGMEHQNIAL